MRDDTSYWRECIEESLSDSGGHLTEAQLDSLASSISISHEYYGMAYYSPPSGEYRDGEIEKLKRELKAERAREICQICEGQKIIVTQGPYHSGTSTCWKCKGDGRV